MHYLIAEIHGRTNLYSRILWSSSERVYFLNPCSCKISTKFAIKIHNYELKNYIQNILFYKVKYSSSKLVFFQRSQIHNCGRYSVKNKCVILLIPVYSKRYFVECFYKICNRNKFQGRTLRKLYEKSKKKFFLKKYWYTNSGPFGSPAHTNLSPK